MTKIHSSLERVPEDSQNEKSIQKYADPEDITVSF